MATKTVTIDTGEWKYPDASGVTHLVTDGQTFTFDMTDSSASDVQFKITANQEITTTDGYKIKINPFVDNTNTADVFGGVLADTQDATTLYGLRGTMVCECSASAGVKQFFRIAQLKLDNVDAPTELTLLAEDQLGNDFLLSAVTVS
jgi:hypothetical protein